MHDADTGPYKDADWAAAILATDPAALGGVLISANCSQAVEAWLGLIRHLLPPGSPLRRMPGHTTEDRLLGGLDLAATLAAGRPVVAHGLLAEVNGGVLVVPMAERLPDATAAQVVAANDLQEVRIERDGFSTRVAACFGIIAINEAQGDERPPQILAERLALRVSLPDDVAAKNSDELSRRVAEARPRYRDVVAGPEVVEALCTAAIALGIGSITASWQALRVAQISAALSGRSSVAEDDVVLAARLVLGPRATQYPAPPDAENDQPDDAPSDEAASPGDDSTGELRDVAVEAARATLPPGLLALLAGTAGRSRTSASGRSGQRQNAMRRGRSVGVRRGQPAGGARLNLIETLRAAAPWQRHRRQALQADRIKPDRIEVRGDDFRVRRLKDRVGNTTIFLVDASGSSALHRLAEAKGAVELLLADCYVRRDQVALIAFGGRGAEILLPPTRSLARARRCLADLPGGGGTPLASGLDAAALMVDAVKRKGNIPGVVVLTDGKANLTRAGSAGRAAAEDEALLAARAMRLLNVKSVLVDTSPRPQAQAARVADALGARYLPLPYADAQTLSQAVRSSQPGRRV